MRAGACTLLLSNVSEKCASLFFVVSLKDVMSDEVEIFVDWRQAGSKLFLCLDGFDLLDTFSSLYTSNATTIE